MRKWTTVLGAAILAVLAPAALAAQACQGSTAPRGSGIVVASASFTDGGNSFGPTLGGNFDGPIFASASYSYTDLDGIDNTQHGLTGQVGGEMVTDQGLSWCLDGSFTHSWISDVDIDGQVYGADTSLGYTADAGDVLVVPHGSVGVVHSTFNAAGIEGSDTAARFAGGVTVGSRTVFVTGSVSYATFDGADPVFGAGVGIVF